MWRVEPEGPGGATGPAPAALPALELEEVTVAFGGVVALRGVTLSIRPGERVAVIGPSGAGKSTLLRLANGATRPTAGRVRVLGQEPAALGPGPLRALRARVGTVWQQLQLVPQASVAENVRMGRVGTTSLAALALGGASRRERARVRAVLAKVGLEDRLDQRLETLSGGEQQRVAVARVLHQAPELVVADEPLASVDPARGAELLRLLLAAAEGRTLLVSTHQLDPVLPWFPRVVGLRDGELLFDLPREQVGADALARLYRTAAAAPSGERVAFAPSPAAAAAAPREPLRVAASSLPGDHVLPRVLAAFRAAHPGVRVELLVSDTGAALDALLAGRADLALVGARDENPELVFEDLFEDEIVLLAAAGPGAAPEGPISAAALAELPRVDREPGSATRRVVEAQLAEMGAPLQPGAAVAEAGSPEALKAAVAAGAGVGFASRLSAVADLAHGRLRVLAVERLRVPRRVYVAVRRAAPPPPPARALVELVRAEAARLGAAG